MKQLTFILTAFLSIFSYGENSKLSNVCVPKPNSKVRVYYFNDFKKSRLQAERTNQLIESYINPIYKKIAKDGDIAPENFEVKLMFTYKEGFDWKLRELLFSEDSIFFDSEVLNIARKHFNTIYSNILRGDISIFITEEGSQIYLSLINK